MYTIVNTGLASDNLGDKIIVELLKDNFSELFTHNQGYFEVGSHDGNEKVSKDFINRSQFCFVTGGNTIPIKKMYPFKNILNIKSSYNKFLKNKIVFIGAGTENYEKNALFNFTAKIYLNYVINHKIPSSTRDIYSKNYLKKLGIKNVYFTGCPTTWGLKDKIKNKKLRACLFTITSHRRNNIKDGLLFKYCYEHFDKVYCWPQQTGDIDYILKLFKMYPNNKSELLGYSLECLKNTINKNEISHSVGTRLHGNLYCLSKGIVPIIISIDNRAAELCTNINLPHINRLNLNIESISKTLAKKEFCVNIPHKEINEFKKHILKNI